jgi:putative chitinase
MNPIQLLQSKLGLKPDGIIGRLTFGQLRVHFDLTQIELAHFLGQCEHETGGFKLWEENLKYSSDGLKRVWPSRYNDDLAKHHEFKQSLIANHVYGGRMGNIQPNDGWHFRGRGAVQLTGRDNYTKFSNWLKDHSVIDDPGQVADKYALESALWFFDTNHLFKYAFDLSESSIISISKGINFGNPQASKNPNGLKDRIEKTMKYAKFVTS